MRRHLFISSTSITRDVFGDWFKDAHFDSWREVVNRGKILTSYGYDEVIPADNARNLTIGFDFFSKSNNESILLSINISRIKRGLGITDEEKKLFQSENGKFELIKEFFK